MGHPVLPIPESLVLSAYTCIKYSFLNDLFLYIDIDTVTYTMNHCLVPAYTYIYVIRKIVKLRFIYFHLQHLKFMDMTILKKLCCFCWLAVLIVVLLE